MCVHNAGRSQMAALLDHHARGAVRVRSAGSAPADRLNPAMAAAMAEWGIDLSRAFPKLLIDASVRAADVVRRIRDDIDGRVRRLLGELVPSASA